MAAKTLACVTMAYNEADMLPVWLRHYGRQAGPENCFVLDHGSDDGSTEGLGAVRVLRLARSALDELKRAEFVSQFCNGLLQHYDFVAYSDADEMLVADPARWATLRAYVQEARAPATTALGLNLVHRVRDEPGWDRARPVLAQRRWGFATSTMCKPLLLRAPVAWRPGFHGSIYPVAFDGLFLFHLAFFDLEAALRRQAKRRGQGFADDRSALHHRAEDATVQGWMEGWARMREAPDVSLTAACPAMTGFVERVLRSAGRDAHGMVDIDLHLEGGRLWRVPERFSGAF